MSFSNYFIQLRKDRNLSQNELAKILKISNTSVRNIEKGRTAIPSHEIFDSLTDYVGGDPVKIAYDIFFENEIEEYGHKLQEINKQYLANRWTYYHIIDIAPRFIYKKNEVLTLDGTFWKAGFPYYKVALRNIDRDQYIDAIRSDQKDEELRDLIFRDTSFVDYIDELGYIKEIRFVLDSMNSDDCMIFDEIKKIQFRNLGKEVEISFRMFNTETMRIDQDNPVCYVTNKKTLIGI